QNHQPLDPSVRRRSSHRDRACVRQAGQAHQRLNRLWGAEIRLAETSRRHARCAASPLETIRLVCEGTLASCAWRAFSAGVGSGGPAGKTAGAPATDGFVTRRLKSKPAERPASRVCACQWPEKVLARLSRDERAWKHSPCPALM